MDIYKAFVGNHFRVVIKIFQWMRDAEKFINCSSPVRNCSKSNKAPNKKSKRGLEKVKEPNSKKLLLCFDLDDTLIDGNRAHIFAFNKAFEENKLKVQPAKRIIKELTGQTGYQIVRHIFPKLKSSGVRKIEDSHKHFMLQKGYKYVKPIKGVKKILNALKKKYELVVASNCSHAVILAMLKNAGIDRNLFDAVIGKEDVRHLKPYPDEIFKAEKLLHVKADYIIGDSIYDVRAGRGAGVKIISVLTGNCTKKQLQREKPTYIIKSLSELSGLLLRE